MNLLAFGLLTLDTSRNRHADGDNHEMHPSPRAYLGQWWPFRSDRVISTVICTKSSWANRTVDELSVQTVRMIALRQHRHERPTRVLANSMRTMIPQVAPCANRNYSSDSKSTPEQAARSNEPQECAETTEPYDDMLCSLCDLLFDFFPTQRCAHMCA